MMNKDEDIINTAIAKAEMLYMYINGEELPIVPLKFENGLLEYFCWGNKYVTNILDASFSYFEEQ